MEKIDIIIDWLNTNSGFVSVLIFLSSIIIAWVTGLFKFLRNKPNFRIEIIDQCTFGSIIDLKRKYKNLPVNKTAFAIYIRVTNIGRSASSIGKIKLGYLKSDFSIRPFTKRIWIDEIMSKTDFRVKFKNSDSIKIYPFLKQHNQYMQNEKDTYLSVGRSLNGVVYFEQNNAYGSYVPRFNKNGKTTNLKVIIEDSFKNKYSKKFDIELIEPDFAFKFNPLFGQTENEYLQKDGEPAANKS